MVRMNHLNPLMNYVRKRNLRKAGCQEPALLIETPVGGSTQWNDDSGHSIQ
jgi:hypothetical protein